MPITFVLATLLMSQPQDPIAWAPKTAPIMTRWAKDVSPTNPHPEYPRPTMVRKDWMNLNGLWDLEIRRVAEPMASFQRWRGEGEQADVNSVPNAQTLEGGGDAEVGTVSFQGKILVPFPVESALSGVMRAVAPEDQLVYRRSFSVPPKWKGKRVLLHFGAVDWACEVLVNGKSVGSHKGGYDPFSFDITDALGGSPTPNPSLSSGSARTKGGEHELTVLVRDPTNKGTQPIGKQILKPEGIWYTPTSGIWQTVWMEPVAPVSIKSFRAVTDPRDGKIEVSVTLSGMPPKDLMVGAMIFEAAGGAPLDSETVKPGEPISLKVRQVRPWSSDSPTLYRLRIQLYRTKPGGSPGETVFDDEGMDFVNSYTAFRTVSLGKDDKGRTRFFLNGKPCFMVGPLDQGFWPDGLYTPPTEKAMKYDLDITKKLGFNMLRKHVKVESERFYYLCDKMGILVFQDMPSGGEKYIGGSDPDMERSKESGDQFLLELSRLIESKRNHPSIVAWVPFNEGWGQWKTPEVTDFVRKLDPTRLVDNPSGWTDRGVGDMMDIHAYPGPASPKPEAKRAAFLGEFGGLGLPMPGHMWQKTGWGYRSFKTQAELSDGIVALFENLRFLIDDPGLSGAVYTQTTDVEQEVNGLMTYDRAIIKPDAARLTKAVKALFLPPPVVATLVPTSEANGLEWSYMTHKSNKSYEGFEKPEFDASDWPKGPGGFGTKITPGHVVRTEWNSPEIWMRREVVIPAGKLSRPHLRIHHDEDVEVYLDGKLLVKRSGYTTGYVLVPIPPAEAKRLTPGKHLLAVHCKQTGGGQYIDVGIVGVKS